MPTASTDQAQPGRVHYKFISPPELWSIGFQREEGDQDDLPEAISPNLEFLLSITRVDQNKLCVLLGSSISGIPGVKAVATFRIFAEADQADPSLLERDLKLIATRIAPMTLYPFIREVITGTLVKANLPPLVPPIVDFNTLFNQEEIVVPPPPIPKGEAETE